MNGIVQKFHSLLERYRFREPVPGNLQKYILRNKRDAAVRTLRHFSDYSFVYGLVLRMFFGVRKIGIRLSIVQSKIAVFLVAVFIVFLIGIGAVLYYDTADVIAPPGKNNIIPRTLPDNSVHPPAFPDRAIKKKENNSVPEDTGMVVEPSVKFRLGVDTFTSSSLDSGETGRIGNLITQELVRLKGKGSVMRLGVKYRRKNANMILLGGVEKLGDTYIITAKIVDVERGTVLASFNDSAGSYAVIDASCVRIAGKVAEKMK
jgi:hypothetical protein